MIIFCSKGYIGSILIGSILKQKKLNFIKETVAIFFFLFSFNFLKIYLWENLEFLDVTWLLTLTEI